MARQILSVVSDIHFKLGAYPKFEESRFTALIDLLIDDISNIVVLNGDILDKARPTYEELSIVIREIVRLSKSKDVYIVDGNHEAITKTSSLYALLFEHLSLSLMPVNENKVINVEGVSLHLVHWSKLGGLLNVNTEGHDVLISHYRSSVAGLYQEEINTSLFTDKYKLIILGDIHMRYSPDTHIHYTSSPYAVHYTRPTAKPDYGYVQIKCMNGSADYRYVDVKLPMKIALDCTVEEYKKLTLNPDNLYKIKVSGTLEEVSKIGSKPNVKLIKEVTHKAVTQPKITTTPFIDTIVEEVNKRVSDTSKTKEILQALH